MQQFEIFPGQRVFVVFAQVAQVVGVVQILEPRGIASELLVVVTNGARVLHSAMDHFLFLIALEIKFNRNHHCQRDYAHERDHQKQIEQNIALLASAAKSVRGHASF